MTASVTSMFLPTILWGVLIATLLTGLVFVIVALLSHGRALSPAQMLVLAVLWLLLAFQAVLFVGAWQLRNYVGEIQPAAMHLLRWIDVSPAFSEAVQAGKTFTDELTCELQSAVNGYMWHRTFWALGFAGLGTAMGVLLCEGGTNNRASHPATHYRRTGRTAVRPRSHRMPRRR